MRLSPSVFFLREEEEAADRNDTRDRDKNPGEVIGAHKSTGVVSSASGVAENRKGVSHRGVRISGSSIEDNVDEGLRASAKGLVAIDDLVLPIDISGLKQIADAAIVIASRGSVDR